MLKIFLERLRQGHRTLDWPRSDAALPERFRGCPVLRRDACNEGCRACAEACPTDALEVGDAAWRVDLGRCLFCTACQEACPQGALSHARDYRLASRKREDLIVTDGVVTLATALDERSRRLFGRSLKLRQVSAAGCNGCEAEANALGNVVFDMGRFGIQFVASPRHADGLVVTGPVSENMREALLKTYDAVPPPRIVIAMGACAISGGIFEPNPEVHRGIPGLLPVDLYVPGCPPHPLTVLDGLLALLGRIDRAKEISPARER